MPGLPLETLTAVWDNTVLKYPNQVAVVVDGQQYTYAALDVEIRKLAARLQDLGVEPGDRVAVAMPNCREFYIAYWAILRAGAILSPVNTRLGRPELNYVFGNLDPKVVFLHQDVSDAVGPSVPDGPHLLGVGVDGSEPFDAAVAAGGEPTELPQDGNAIAFIAHTSGTTGVPKGAIMRHCDLRFNTTNTVIPFGWRHEDVHLLLVPLFHATGLYSVVPSSCYLGSTVVMAPRPDPREVVELLAKERCTTFLSVPTFHLLVVSLPGLDQYDLSALRMIGYSGSPMPTRTIERLRTAFPHARLHNFFGLTETISLTHITPSNCALSHADSIGKVIPEVGMKLVTPEGAPCGPNEVGLLHIHRSNAIQGYWNRPGLLEESLTTDGEWFNTGDLARVDADGFVYLEGRHKDMIIVAGENVFALEVERCIVALDGVKEVAVIGVEATGMRASLGELVKAVVVLAPGATLTKRDVKRHCVERLASYKVPQLIEFREQLPRNPSGKVLKRALTEEGA